ncbi:NitT/TauT family transport system substrate-binding protein [Actinoplanes lutulentus]|uniref:NitT/TauT family transport system substrate-binding protein n=1 Tax=Actinoplanes lutulentus TaxID=1287878 RepID=A0A327ZAH9_9ACTN|nr:ABC transporter substrate-binding protein [Actinoplanes lutulentus]MBB2946302.1 NitT/TauT family transport system substrate-binding protein [Actinoplanes lutulentus]RAK28759.1 NitT/TauT family transport system substrate-binding protein [Actinoplanes lutulentus]
MLTWRTKRIATRRARRAWLAGLAAATLVVAGCGGGEDNGSDGSSGDGIAVTIRSTGPTFTDLITLVIIAQDYFTEVGLDADFEFILASNAATATQGLIAGEMDVASGGAGSLYNAYAEGRTELVSLGTANPAVTFGLAINNETAAQFAAKGVTPDSPVDQRVKALAGTSLASSPEGSTGQKYLRIMLTEHGVDPDRDVTLVPNADNAAQLAAAREKRVNGFANSFPNVNLPGADGWGVLWLNWAVDLPSILPLASHEYYTTRSWLEKNPEAAKRLMKALWLAYADLQNPTDELRDKIKALEGFQGLNPEGFDAGWELSLGAYKDGTPLTTQEMFDNQKDLVNYGREKPITFGFGDLYDLAPVTAAQP